MPKFFEFLSSIHLGFWLVRIRQKLLALKQWAKHAAKIHVWAGISSKGATRIVMFGGILIADQLGIIFENALAPFI